MAHLVLQRLLLHKVLEMGRADARERPSSGRASGPARVAPGSSGQLRLQELLHLLQSRRQQRERRRRRARAGAGLVQQPGRTQRRDESGRTRRWSGRGVVGPDAVNGAVASAATQEVGGRQRRLQNLRK